MRVYLAYIVFFLVFFYGWRELGNSFWTAQSVHLHLAQDTETGGPDIVYTHINSLGHVIQWINNVVVPSFFQDEWFPGDPSSAWGWPAGKYKMATQNKGYINQATRLIGAMRVRQWKSAVGSCTNPYNEDGLCFGSFEVGAQKGSFSGLNNNSDSKQFQPSDCEKWGSGIAFYGREAVYSCSHSYEFYIPFTATQDDALKITEDHFGYLWADGGTRAILVEFVTHTPSAHALIHHRYVVEIMSSGYVDAKREVRPFRLSPIQNNSALEWIGVVFQCVFLLFSLYYMIAFVWHWRQYGVFSQKALYRFLSGWNMVEFGHHFMIIAIVIVRFLWFFDSGRIDFVNVKKGTYMNPTYPMLDRCVLLWVIECYMVSLLAIVVFARLFKFINVNPRLNLLIRTLKRCTWSLFAMSIIFFIALTGMVLAAYMLFFPYDTSFKSLDSAYSVLLRVLLGDTEIYGTMRDINRWVTPVFFLIYTFFGVFVILNMILAVIVDSFEKEVEEGDAKGFSDLGQQMRKVFSRCWASCCGRICGNKPRAPVSKDLDIDHLYQTLVEYKKKVGGKGTLTLDHLMEIFDLTRPEAVELMRKLDVDGSGTIELDEIEVFKMNHDEAQQEPQELEMEDLMEPDDENPTDSPQLATTVTGLVHAHNALMKGKKAKGSSYIPPTLPATSAAPENGGGTVDLTPFAQQLAMLLQKQEELLTVTRQSSQSMTFSDAGDTERQQRQDQMLMMVQKQMQQQQLLLQQQQTAQQGRLKGLQDGLEEANRHISDIDFTLNEIRRQVASLGQTMSKVASNSVPT
eukprot:TRINITY_DN54570_c0_g1_i1.p1 TRINITY_DN54570_c0_g1~~TRINITY_DN54570_c0_g1_i1.p1  ORF type:complete len:855 (-),score=76.42 TRINITY_DN54570_c0_g1_i1:798-3188(-)